jgi:hypothetical protein
MSLGIESGNATPIISIKAITPPTLPGDTVAARLDYPKKCERFQTGRAICFAAALRYRTALAPSNVWVVYWLDHS